MSFSKEMDSVCFPITVFQGFRPRKDGEGDAQVMELQRNQRFLSVAIIEKKRCSLGNNFYNYNINQAATINSTSPR
jgi:hypothetical protein